jgi:AAA domain, putative AbiEii toxin, Type IV TA system
VQSGQLADPQAMFEGECTMSCQGFIAPKPYHIRVTYKDIVGYPTPPENEHQGQGPNPQGERIGEEEVGDIQPRRGAQITVHDSHGKTRALDPIWEGQPVVFVPRLGPPLPRHETITPYSYQINSFQVRYLSVLGSDPQKDRVLDLVREFDPEVEDIDIKSFRGTRPAIYLKHRRLGLAPLSVFGEGFRRAVFLGIVLPTLMKNDLEGGGILFIDDIDTGIHVRALKRVFSWLVKAARGLEVQIVATTHSLEAVDAIALAAEDHIDDLVTFRLEQSEQGTRAKRIYGDLLLRMRRERAMDVR